MATCSSDWKICRSVYNMIHLQKCRFRLRWPWRNDNRHTHQSVSTSFESSNFVLVHTSVRSVTWGQAENYLFLFIKIKKYRMKVSQKYHLKNKITFSSWESDAQLPGCGRSAMSKRATPSVPTLEIHKIWFSLSDKIDHAEPGIGSVNQCYLRNACLYPVPGSRWGFYSPPAHCCIHTHVSATVTVLRTAPALKMNLNW